MHFKNTSPWRIKCVVLCFYTENFNSSSWLQLDNFFPRSSSGYKLKENVTAVISSELFNDIWLQLNPKYLCLCTAKEWPIWFRLTPLSACRLGRKNCTGRTSQAVPSGSDTYHQPSEIPPRFTPLWIILPTGTMEHWRGEKSDTLFRKTQGGLGIVWGVGEKKKGRKRGRQDGERIVGWRE